MSSVHYGTVTSPWPASGAGPGALLTAFRLDWIARHEAARRDTFAAARGRLLDDAELVGNGAAADVLTDRKRAGSW